MDGSHQSGGSILLPLGAVIVKTALTASPVRRDVVPPA